MVGVKDNQIIQVKGDPEGFLNKGYTCYKGNVSQDRLYHPDRLRNPLKRAGKRGEGKWQRISWEDALDETAENLLRIKETYGARGVGFGVGMPKGLEHFDLIRLANIFGSPNVIASQDVCHAPRENTGVHTCGFYPVADFHHPTRLVLSWASNLLSTNDDGDEVLIHTRYVNTTQTARVTERVHPRVVSADLGWWFPEGDAAWQFEWRRSNFNMLTSIGRLGKEFGTPNIANLPCSIEKYAP